MTDTHVLVDDPNQLDLGSLLIHDDQPFRLVGVRPHRTRDGRHIQIQTWRARCVVCLELYEFTRSTTQARFEPTRRCAAHRAPWMTVKQERRQAQRAAWRAARGLGPAPTPAPHHCGPRP